MPLKSGFKILKQESSLKYGGLKVYTDMSDFRTITLNSDDISNADDKSGSGSDLAQAVAAEQPVYLFSGMNGIGSMQTDSGNPLEKLGSTIDISTQFTLFMVIDFFSLSIIANTTLLLAQSGGLSYGIDILNASNKISSGWYSGATYNTLVSDYAVSSNDKLIITIIYDIGGNVHKMRINGVQQSQTTTASTALSVGTFSLTLGNHIFAARCGTIKYGNYVFYSGIILSNEKILDLESSFANQWGISI